MRVLERLVQKSLHQSRISARARTGEALGKSMPFAPLPPLLRARCTDQTLPFRRLRQENQTPPSHKPPFIRRLHFREKNSGIWFRDPMAKGPCGRRSPVRPSGEGGRQAARRPHRRSPREGGSARLANISRSRRASERLPGVLRRATARWDRFPVLGPKYGISSQSSVQNIP